MFYHKIIPCCIGDLYYNIRNFFFPRQRWLTKKIPRHWVDKDTLFEICILESIKHYVDKNGEHCFGVLAHGDTCEEPQRTFMREVKENYDLITIRLPELEKSLEAAWEKITTEEIKTNSKGFCIDWDAYKDKYSETDHFETEIHNLKTKVMMWAVEKRNWIWT